MPGRSSYKEPPLPLPLGFPHVPGWTPGNSPICLGNRLLTRANGRPSLGVLLFLCLCSWLRDVSAQNRPLPSAETIIQKSVQANQADWAQAPQYNYFERDEEGKHTKTYQVIMLDGSPYSRLVAVDGQPLSATEQAAEEQKFAKAKAEREAETPGQRQKRIAAYKKDRKRDRLLMDQLVQAFQFQLQGQQKLGPYKVYVLRATPRPDYHPPNRDTQVLTGMQGMLWIDQNTYQWVKVRAWVVHPVSIEGFLARVEPGIRFELEKIPVAPGVWLPKHFAMKAKAKILDVFHHNSQEEETYFNYSKGSTAVPGSQESRVRLELPPADGLNSDVSRREGPGRFVGTSSRRTHNDQPETP